MKKLITTLCLLTATLVGTGYAGSSCATKFETVTPFYRDKEANITVFGGRQVSRGDSWAVGIDGKYFFNRYFGLGMSGYYLDRHTATGSLMATVTARYPIGRVAPYTFVGAGGIGDRNDIRAAAQVGGGVEFRITPRVGYIADYSYNFVDSKQDKNFGLVRTGLNFSF